MKFDKTKGYKIVNGEFVERTPEEQAELTQRRAAWEVASNQGPTIKAAPIKMPKSMERFTRVTISQAERLLQLEPPAFVTIYLWLSFKSFEAHGLPFDWPTDTFAKSGIDRWAQRRALTKLVQAGLISIERAPPKPPKVTVL
jgi:hypothetical protein